MYISRDLGRIIEDALTESGDYFIGNPRLAPDGRDLHQPG